MSVSTQLAERLAARAETPVEEPEEELFEEEAPEEEAPEGGYDDPEDEPEEGDEPDDEAPEEIANLHDFARAAGWEPKDLYDLTLKMESGEELTLSQVKDRARDYTRHLERMQQAEEQTKAFANNLRVQAQQFFQQRASEDAALSEARSEALAIKARYDSVDWGQLEQANPGQAALLQQRLAAEYAGAQQRAASAEQAAKQAASQYLNTARAEHARAFLQAVPEWQDPSVAQTEATQVEAYLRQWFPQEELAGIFDWRARMLARKAWLYDQERTKVNETAERLRKAPKPVLRSGAGQPLRGKAQADKTSTFIERAKKSGSREERRDAARMVLERALKGGARKKR